MYFTSKFSILSDDTVLWRYMSYSKFEDLIKTSTLYFCRADKFEDKLEVTQPKASLSFAISTQNPWHMYERNIMDAYLHMLRTSTFVNCWHISNFETNLMWENYAEKNGAEGIAIQTNLGSLKKAFYNEPRKITDMKIKYVDFSTFNMNYFNENPFNFLTLKDKEYTYENELRLITIEDVYPTIDEDNVNECPMEYTSHSGEKLKVDLNRLIKKIIISPKGTDRFINLITELLNEYHLSFEIQKSVTKAYDCRK